jgi:hypothetical protein
MFTCIRKFLHVKTDKEYIEEYLAKSISLQDLERRQKELRKLGYLA